MLLLLLLLVLSFASLRFVLTTAACCGGCKCCYTLHEQTHTKKKKGGKIATTKSLHDVHAHAHRETHDSSYAVRTASVGFAVCVGFVVHLANGCPLLNRRSISSRLLAGCAVCVAVLLPAALPHVAAAVVRSFGRSFAVLVVGRNLCSLSLCVARALALNAAHSIVLLSHV